MNAFSCNSKPVEVPEAWYDPPSLHYLLTLSEAYFMHPASWYSVQQLGTEDLPDHPLHTVRLPLLLVVLNLLLFEYEQQNAASWSANLARPRYNMESDNIP